jgi:hypothetical protein
MNTWTSWGLADTPFSAAGVVLHSVPPLVVFATAETGPGLRDRLTEAVHRALTEHRPAPADAVVGGSTGGDDAAPAARPALDGPDTTTSTTGPGVAAREPVREPRPVRRPGPARRARKPAPRRLLADFVDQAQAERARVEAAGQSVEVTPAWCREVTGCSAGTSVKVAAALRAEPLPSPSVISPVTSRPSAGEEVAA